MLGVVRSQEDFAGEVRVQDWGGYLSRGEPTLPHRELRTPRDLVLCETAPVSVGCKMPSEMNSIFTHFS